MAKSGLIPEWSGFQLPFEYQTLYCRFILTLHHLIARHLNTGLVQVVFLDVFVIQMFVNQIPTVLAFLVAANNP